MNNTGTSNDDIVNEFDFETVELGNLLLGNSRGRYQIPRGSRIEETFIKFLVENGFDWRGYMVSDSLKEHKRREVGNYHTITECNTLSENEIKENGLFVADENNIDYDGKIYRYNGDEYLIYPELTDEYLEQEKKYYDALYEWEFELIENDESSSCSEKDAPDEIKMLKPVLDSNSYVNTVAEYILKSEENYYFENAVFIVRPYFWGESEEIAAKPNFVYKPDNIEIDWYKYPMRDAYCNKKMTADEFGEMMEKCKESLM